MNAIAHAASPLVGPSRGFLDLLARVAAVCGGAALTAALARVSVPLPGTPVPMTLQTLGVSLVALTLGVRMGTASMGLYWILAAAGAPVLAQGQGGWEFVIGATGGYLAGFVLAQPAMAWAARSSPGGSGGAGSTSGLLLAMVLGNLIVLACGVGWLAFRGRLGLEAALAQGLWPFVPGMLVKSAAAMICGYALVPWGIRRGW